MFRLFTSIRRSFSDVRTANGRAVPNGRVADRTGFAACATPTPSVRASAAASRPTTLLRMFILSSSSRLGRGLEAGAHTEADESRIRKEVRVGLRQAVTAEAVLALRGRVVQVGLAVVRVEPAGGVGGAARAEHRDRVLRVHHVQHPEEGLELRAHDVETARGLEVERLRHGPYRELSGPEGCEETF